MPSRLFPLLASPGQVSIVYSQDYPGANPDRCPGFRSLQRQERPRELPSLLVFLPISSHFTATPGIPLSSTALKLRSIERRSLVEPRNFTPDLQGRLRALYAQ